MDSPVTVYDAKLSTRSRLQILGQIKRKLSANNVRYKMFKETVFGPWLDIRTYELDNHMIHYLLLHQRYVKDPHVNTPFYFDVGKHKLEFGRKEFSLITGFRMGDCSLESFQKAKQNSFRHRVFPEVERVKGSLVSDLVTKHNHQFNSLSDIDAVRVCLLFALEVFIGPQLRHVIPDEILNLVDYIDSWNKFPWGQYIWEEFHNRVYNTAKKYAEKHLRMVAANPSHVPQYTLQGFIFPLKIWILESFPDSKEWWSKEVDAIPRCVAWSHHLAFSKLNYPSLFHYRIRLNTLVPTADEMNMDWWKDSAVFIDAVSEATTSQNNVCSKETKRRSKRKALVSRTEVHREVTIHTEYVDFEDEGLSGRSFLGYLIGHYLCR